MDYRSLIHKAVDIHIERLINSYYYLVDSGPLELLEGTVEKTGLDNFQLKLHTYHLLHSCRSLLQVSSDLCVNDIVHDITGRAAEVAALRQKLDFQVKQLRQQLRLNKEEETVDRGAGEDLSEIDAPTHDRIAYPLDFDRCSGPAARNARDPM